MSCAEKLFKVLSFGLWNPTYSRSERQSFQELLTVLEPVYPLPNELGRVSARFSDGSSLRISVTNSELVEAEIRTANNEKITVLLESNEQIGYYNLYPSIATCHTFRFIVPYLRWT